jgi:tetratricopeptide (TPR) repeat protein
LKGPGGEALAQIYEEYRTRSYGWALVGRINPRYPDYLLAFIDVDDPDKFPEEVGKMLEGRTWHWLTGPRCPIDGAKHGVVCEGAGKEAKCRHGGHEFKLGDARRGKAFAVLIPASREDIAGKYLGGAVELRVNGYQLIPPSLHPSGVQYEWVIGPNEEPLALSDAEVEKLVAALGAGGEGGGQGGEAAMRTAEPCPKRRRLGEKALDALAAELREVWAEGLRNALLYSVLGIMYRACIDKESAVELYRRLRAFDPTLDEGKDLYIIDGIYSRDWRRYGKRKLAEALTEAYKRRGYAGKEAKAAALEKRDKILRLLGAPRWERALILISNRGKLAGANNKLYYANDPSVGIAMFIKRERCKAECDREGLRGCIKSGGDRKECRKKHCEEVCEASWGWDAVARYAYIDKAIEHLDPATGMALYTVRLCNKRSGRCEVHKYVDIYELAEAVKGIGVEGVADDVLVRVLRSILTVIAKREKTPPVSGVLLINGELKAVAKGPFAKNFREVLRAEGDPRAFIEMMERFYGNDPKAYDAYAVGLFQIFNAARKKKGLRNKVLVLTGEPSTGKTAILEIIITKIYNFPGDRGEEGGRTAVFSGGALMSPARLARDLNFSGVAGFDEAKALTFNQATAEVFKRAVNSFYVYERATSPTRTTQHVAYAGMIITTQTIRIDDAGVRDRVYIINFTLADVKRGHGEFAKFIEAHKRDLMAFGRLYIETLIKRPDIVFMEDYVQAAREALKAVLEKLGREPVYPSEEGATEEGDEEVRFARMVRSKLEAICLRLDNCRDTVDRRTRLEEALKYIGSAEVGVEYVGGDVEGEVRIYREAVDLVRGTSLANLAAKINRALGREAAAIKHTNRANLIKIDKESFLDFLEGA